jgi:hypothetical protein
MNTGRFCAQLRLLTLGSSPNPTYQKETDVDIVHPAVVQRKTVSIVQDHTGRWRYRRDWRLSMADEKFTS